MFLKWFVGVETHPQTVNAGVAGTEAYMSP